MEASDIQVRLYLTGGATVEIFIQPSEEATLIDDWRNQPHTVHVYRTAFGALNIALDHVLAIEVHTPVVSRGPGAGGAASRYQPR